MAVEVFVVSTCFVITSLSDDSASRSAFGFANGNWCETDGLSAIVDLAIVFPVPVTVVSPVARLFAFVNFKTMVAIAFSSTDDVSN